MTELLPEPQFPCLSGCSLISVDLETKDPNLKSHGPGDRRGDGKVLGISISTDRYTGYYPIGHVSDNLDRRKVFEYLRNQLSGPEPKVGANIIYDMGWLETIGVKMGGPKYDVLIMDAIIYELHQSYSLDSVANRWLGVGKEHNDLMVAAREYVTNQKEIMSNLDKIPARFVAQYAKKDAELPRLLFPILKEKIDELKLDKVFQLESDLTTVLHEMRMRGMPISYNKAEQAVEQLAKAFNDEMAYLKTFVGGGAFDIWSSNCVSKVFDLVGIEYPRTDKGAPSFTAQWLSTQEDPLPTALLQARRLDRAGEVYIKDKILGYAVKGRIHPRYNQTRSETGGTRSGRLSSANPNLQQFPARDGALAPIVRGCFIADPGYSYGIFDYSQQEPRVTVDMAFRSKLDGAQEVVESYIKNPRIDYHQAVVDRALALGYTITRFQGKTLNLGMAYGMGIFKLSTSLGLTMDKARPVFKGYHAAVPYVKPLGDLASRVAKQRGYVKTILGRRRNFPSGSSTHKALNAAVQGSSADMMKKALVDLFNAGWVPYNTVHDECDGPVADLKEAKLVRDVMESAIKISVPLIVDVKLGETWGNAKDARAQLEE